MAAEVEFVDEMPLRERGPGRTAEYDWEGIAVKLKNRPGKWARVLINVPRSHAGAIKRGEKTQFRPAEDWDVMCKGPRGSRCDLFMVYLGVPGARATAYRRPGRGK